MSTCEQARALIDALVTDELSDEDRAALAAHVRSCAACAAELGSATRMLELFAGLADVPVSDGFDERVLAAAFADRDRRMARKSWLSTLWRQAWHGAVRTTGTLAITIIVMAFAATTLVVAAVLVSGRGDIVGINPPRSTPAATHTVIAAGTTASPSPTATPSPVTITTAPVLTPNPTPQPTPAPAVTPQPTPRPTPIATPRPTPSPTPAPTAEPTPTPAPSVSATPEPEPTPSPTPKRRTPPPSPSAESQSP